MSCTSDILIIGNGALGLSAAFASRSSDPDLTVTLVGPRRRPGAASPAAGAMTGTWGEVTAAGLRHAPGRLKHALAVEALKRWPTWLEQLNAGLPPDLRVAHHPGTFIIRNTVAGPIEDDNFAAIVESLDAHGEAHERVRPADVPGLMPNANTRALDALYIPREGRISSAQLLAALERRLEDDPGVTLIDGAAQRLEIDRGRCTGAVLESGETVTAAHTVLAAGARCQALLDGHPALARRIPRLITSVGTALLVRPPMRRHSHVIRTPNRAAGCGLHVVPREGDRLYIGATSTVHLAPRDRPVISDMHSLITWAQQQIDMSLGAARFVEALVGNRPVALDAFPLVGPLSVDGLSMASGTFRDGLHMSPVIGPAMAATARGARDASDALFHPERRPIAAFEDREQAIAAGVAQMMSSAWEHQLIGVKTGFPRRLRLMFERMVRALYDGFEIDYVPPTALLIPVEMVRTLDARAARVKEIEALFADLIAAHGG